ncbi:MAG: hypothetical protein HOK67_29395, partial [Deltaproteobacteria bacterium]|nr:hypothetical protein [Deltaproteobacteria bacterium]
MNKKKRRSLPVEGWIKIFIFWLGILVAFPNAHSLMAMTDSDRQLLKLFQEEEPEIFSRSKLVSERDRQLLEIS